MKKKSVLVLGYFGYITNQLDGQTIKTRNIYNLLKSKEDQLGIVRYFDSEQFKNNKLSVLKMLWKLVNSNNLIYLPAYNNLKYILPFLFVICCCLRIKIFYVVIGGWLNEYLENLPLHRAMLKRISSILPETNELIIKLKENFGFANLTCLPNFRIHDFKPEIKINPDKFRIVFMARINSKKGIDTVFKIADYFQNNKNENKDISVDFWGPIEPIDKENFLFNIERHLNTTYKGQLAPNKIYNTLSQYDVMVLPTKYYTEGFPGSILDAYISGIPVIVTKWKHADEFVTHGKTGYIVPFENGEKMMIKYLIDLSRNIDLLLNLKRNAAVEAQKYSYQVAWSVLSNILN